jgi:hypothetical protein
MADTKEIELLKKQISKLTNEDFDLSAWKSGAVVLLERLFGPDNQKIRQIEKIRYDQSSWAMRDANGSTNLMESCKLQGKEILLTAVDELKNFGLPKEVAETRSAPFKSVILAALEDELKITQYREVLRIIDADKSFSEKKKELIEKMNDFGHDCADNILASILLADETKQNI